MACLEIDGRGDEVQCNRLSRRGIRQQLVVGPRVDDVDKSAEVKRFAGVFDPSVGEPGARLNLVGAGAGENRAAGAGGSPFEGDPALSVVPIEAGVEFGLRGAGVGIGGPKRPRSIRRERRASNHRLSGGIARVGRNRNLAGRTSIRRRVEIAGTHPIRPAIVQGMSGAHADVVDAARRAARRRTRVAIDAAGAEHDPRLTRGLSRRLRDDVHDPGERVGAPYGRRGTSHHLDLLDVTRIDRNRVPEDEAVKVQIQRAAVDQGELRGGQRVRGLSRRDVHVACGQLDYVEARNGPEEVAIVLRRRRAYVRGRNHRDGRRRVDERSLHS